MDIRETILQSLSAIGAQRDAKYYAELFARQDAETFAMIVLDPRCLKNPLLEALSSALRILSNLDLTPILIVGALGDPGGAKIKAQSLSRDLEKSGVKNIKLDTASYGLIAEVRRKARVGNMPILIMTDRRGKMNLSTLTNAFQPRKLIFLQPSGGLNQNGLRKETLTIEQLPDFMETENFSAGQIRFLDTVLQLDAESESRRNYIIASPLNLLGELFTERGSGTLIRRGADVVKGTSFDAYSIPKLSTAIDTAFEKRLNLDFFDTPLAFGCVDSQYRGGALFKSFDTDSGEITYLSKFFVIREARGEGIGRDIWDAACEDMSSFVWRSRLENPFNDWYMKKCDGMQIAQSKMGDISWRVFWKGLDPQRVPDAVQAVISMPDDFTA